MWEYLYQVVDDGGSASFAKNLPLLPDLDHAHNFRVDFFILLAEDAFEGFWEDLHVILNELRALVLTGLLEWEGWETDRVRRDEVPIESGVRVVFLPVLCNVICKIQENQLLIYV